MENTPQQGYWLKLASLVQLYAESLWLARECPPLANVLYDVIDRAYRFVDRRELEPDKKLGWPGVSCEYWGQNGVTDGEGYGWGATLPGIPGNADP